MTRKSKLHKELSDFPIPNEKESQHIGKIQELKGSSLCEVYVPYDEHQGLYKIHPKFRNSIYLKRGNM
jgi:hypothetical protein